MGFEQGPLSAGVRREEQAPPSREEVRIASLDRDAFDSLMARTHTPMEVIEFFDAEFKAAFDADSGSDGYTIRRHTLMVMGQFRKYFSYQPLPGGVSSDLIEMTLALHDIGKPEAIAEGSKDRQHEFTDPHIRAAARALGYGEEQVRLAASLAAADTIGLFLMRKGSAEEHAQALATAAQGTGLTTQEFYDLVKIFYQSDAGSYTVDAGGSASLDNLFEFEPDDRIMSFSPRIQARIDELDAAVEKIASAEERRD